MAKEKKVRKEVSTDKLKARIEAIASLNSKYGKGTIMKFADTENTSIEVIPSGSLSIDHALGRGGYPRGRIVEIFGLESCLDGDTFIQYRVQRENGKIINSKGGTIKRLWERFHGEDSSGDGRGKYYRPCSEGVVFFAPSINEEDRVFQNRITDVVRIGDRECFELTTLGGYSIIATGDHKFYNGNTYVKLSDLVPGNTLFMHTNTPFTKQDGSDEQDEAERKYLYVKQHPIAGNKKVKNSSGEYIYKRVLRSRAIMEAHINNMEFSEFLSLLNSNADLSNFKFLSRDDHVHHLDEDHSNDSLTNLVVLSSREHGQMHALERHNNLRFMATEDIVFSIKSVGIREVFDIKMMSPFNNFVANKFITHNSGKTTLTLHAMAECQKMGGTVAFIDAEHALDPAYATALGVDMDEVFLSQPDNGEQALDVVEELVRSNSFDLIVVDSVAALVPKAELEGEMGASHVGLQARLMSQALRKLTALVHESKCVLFFINQVRMKIGIMYGNPETTTGGNALKFYSTVRLDIRRSKALKEGDKLIGNEITVKVVKNKVAPPFRVANFNIMYGKGIDRLGEILDFGITLGLVEKSGAWYSCKGERIGQGKENACEYISSRPELISYLEDNINMHYQKGTIPTPIVVDEDGVIQDASD